MKRLLLAFLIVTGFWYSTCHPQPKAHLSSPGKDSLYVIGRATSDGIGKFFQGREIARVMGASGADWLERGDRQQEENTDLAIEKMNLAEGAAVADIGAGTGYYSFRLASKVPKGTVYAVDIQPEMIDYLNKKKASLKVSNVRVVEGSPESPNLPDSSIDLAIMVDVYHELEYPFETIRSIKKCLKPAGKILLIEYRGEDPSIPIKALHKTTVEQLTREMKLNGFKLSYRGDFLPIQHFLVFEGVDYEKT